MTMIHFDWDILGVNLEMFSLEMTPLQPCLGETIVTPKQVELFTSLLHQEATTVETSSLRPTMFPQSIFMSEKPQHVRQMPVDVITNAPVTENTTPSVEVLSTQIPTTQKSVIQLPMAKPLIVQTSPMQLPTAQVTVTQIPVNTPSITIKASISAPLQPTVSLENLEALESLEVLDHLAPLEALEPLETAAMPLVMENAKPSLQEPVAQMPMPQKLSVQIPTPQKPSVQMPVAQMPVAQMPVAQMPIFVQTTSAQEPVSTPYITVKASVSTPLQPTVPLESLDFLEPLVHLEPLETAPIAPATANTTPSMEVLSTQMPVAQMPVVAQTTSTQEPVSASYITVKAPVSAPLQPMASLENLEALESLEVLNHLEPLETTQKPVMVAANTPATENVKPSVEASSTQMPTAQTPLIAQMSSTQAPTAQISMAQMPTVQMPSMEIPVIAQTLSAQESVNTPYITVKAPVSVLLQPMASLEVAQMPVMAAANAPAMENEKLFVEVPSTQMPIAQTPSTQVPTAQKLVFTQMASTQMPMAQTPVIAQTLSVQEPVVVATSKPIIEKATPSVEVPSTQVPTTQMPPMQEPVAQIPIIAQTVSAQMPVNTPQITVKASVAVPLQPTASLENLVALVPLETLDTAAMPHAIENARSSVQEFSAQMTMPQKPSVQIPIAQIPTAQIPSTQMPVAQMPSMQEPVAQKPIIAQTASAQLPVNTPYITVKAPVSTPLQPTAPLESLESLEVLDHLEPLKTAAMAPAIENAKQPSVEMHSTQTPMVAQMPSTQMPSTQMPMAQKPITAQTASAQVLTNTPYITVKPSISTLLQPTAPLESLVFLEPLVHLEPLETAAMAPAMENAKSSVREASVQMPIPQMPAMQILTPQKPSAQIPTAQKPITAQTPSAPMLANTPYITVKPSVSTLLQPTALLESLVFLEPLVHLEPLKNLEPLETAAMAPAMENVKSSVQEASVQMPIPQQPSAQIPTAQKPIILQTSSAHESASASYITGKVSVSTPQQPMASLENLVLLEPLEILETPTMENTKPSVQLPITQRPTAQIPSTQVPVAQKPITVQTQSAHISTHTPYITIKPPHSFIQKLEAPQKPLQKPSSMPDVVAPSIHAAATAISQPTDLAMPSVAPVNASSMAMSPAQILSATVNELTSAIMVNIDENGHLGEIRLVLKPDVLDGTTILLKCDQKQISVTFFPGAESAEQLLMANQNRIAETLAATGHLPVKISIINSEGRRQIRKTA